MPAQTTCEPPPVLEPGVIPGLQAVPLHGPPAAMVFTKNGVLAPQVAPLPVVPVSKF
jgi:hypothetical protein